MEDTEGLDVDDQWLYGDAPGIEAINPDAPADNQETSNQEEGDLPQEGAEDQGDASQEEGQLEVSKEEGKEPGEIEAEDSQGEAPAAAEGEETEKVNGEGSDKEESDEDDSDDDNIKVFIGDASNVTIDDKKTYASGQSASLNVKRGGLIPVTDRSKQSGKFNVEEFEQMGSINGVPAADYNLDSLEDKPWRKPGADITDYFNYGFNEDTWKAYCERQKRLRVHESGVGIIPLNAIGLPRGVMSSVMNDNSKYGGAFGTLRKAGPPPGRRMMGSIDVIGNNNIIKIDAPKENVIQVMTADRREYSRKPAFPDMSMPPPVGVPPPTIVPVGPPPPDPFEQFQPEFGFNPEPEPFYGGYEPTQDVQWGVSEQPPPAGSIPGGPPGWPGGPSPTIIGGPPPIQDGPLKTLVGGPPPGIIAPPGNTPPGVVTIPIVMQPAMVPPGPALVPLPAIVPQTISNPTMGGHSGVDTPPPSSRGGGDSNSPPPASRRGGSREPSRSRSVKRDRTERDRESSRRETRRDRSRSRSRRHKSRSRSPSHRSHRKKKSRRHEDSD